jgi:hypothetical protein
MVSETGQHTYVRAAAAREFRLEYLGILALGLSLVSVVLSIFHETRELAWLAALPAVLLAGISLGMQVSRKRYATVALLLGWFCFALSFAMMIWGGEPR